MPYYLRLVWVSLVSFPILANTARGAVEGDFQFETNNTGAVITDYLGSGANVVIPRALGGIPVTGIGSWAFRRDEESDEHYDSRRLNLNSGGRIP
jgi:hypothetical protein